MIAQLGGLRDEVRGVGSDLEESIERVGKKFDQLDGQLDSLRLEMSEVRGELATTRSAAEQLRDQLGDAVELLPDSSSRGPIARARDVISGTER